MLNFGPHGMEEKAEPTREEWITLYKDAFQKIKDNHPQRSLYIRGILNNIVDTHNFTKEEFDLTDQDIQYLQEEERKLDERRELKQKIDILRRDIEIEMRKFAVFRNKKLLSEKASAIKKLLENSSITYEDCKVDRDLIEKLSGNNA